MHSTRARPSRDGVLKCRSNRIEVMNKVVRENYPASRLPDDLRGGIDLAATVTVTVTQDSRPDQILSLDEIFAMRLPPYRSKEEIDAEIRRQREEWND